MPPDDVLYPVKDEKIKRMTFEQVINEDNRDCRENSKKRRRKITINRRR